MRSRVYILPLLTKNQTYFLIMKKITLLLITALCISLNAYSYDLAINEEKITQVILRGVIAKQPRSGSLHQLVNCYYYNGSLYVDCNVDVEMIQVSVTSTNTGDQYEEYSDGYIQSLSVSVPNTPGMYYVEITIDSSTLYGYYQI